MLKSKTDKRIPFTHPDINTKLCVDVMPGKRLTIEGLAFIAVGAAWSNIRKRMELGLVLAT